MAQALPPLVKPRKPFVPSQWVSPSVKPKNLYELVYRQPNFGIGARYTHEVFMSDPEFKEKPTYWTITEFKKRKSKKTWCNLPRGKAWGFLTYKGVIDPKVRRIESPLKRGWKFIEGSIEETQNLYKALGIKEEELK